MRVPVVRDACHGCIDAIVDGETGVLVPPGDDSSWKALLWSISKMLGCVSAHGQRPGTCTEQIPRPNWLGSFVSRIRESCELMNRTIL